MTIGLIVWRGDQLRSPGRIDSPLSREGAFLANNVLFGAFAFVVLLGTVFPLIVEAINGNQISVGSPYFNRMTLPIAIALLFLMAVAPVLPWRKASGELLRHRLLLAGLDRHRPRWWSGWWPARRGLAPLIAYGLAGFAAGSAGRQLVLATRRQGWRGLVGRANGGMIVHIGIVMIAVAFAASASNVRQAELTLHPGQTAEFDGHTHHLPAAAHHRLGRQEPDQRHRHGRRLGSLRPGHRRLPPVRRDAATRSAPRRSYTSPRGDVALSLLAVPATNSNTVTMRVTSQPLVMWLWMGGGVIGLGTALAAFPGKRRRPTQPVSAPVPDRRPGRADPGPAGEPPDRQPETVNARHEPTIEPA